MKWFESHWYGMFPAKERTACFIFFFFVARVCVCRCVCVYNLLEISCSGWNYLHVLLSRSNQAQKCNVHVDKTGLQMCTRTPARAHTRAKQSADTQADQITFCIDSELLRKAIFLQCALLQMFLHTRNHTHSGFSMAGHDVNTWILSQLYAL